MTIDYHKAVCWFIDNVLTGAVIALFMWTIGYSLWSWLGWI